MQLGVESADVGFDFILGGDELFLRTFALCGINIVRTLITCLRRSKYGIALQLYYDVNELSFVEIYCRNSKLLGESFYWFCADSTA